MELVEGRLAGGEVEDFWVLHNSGNTVAECSLVVILLLASVVVGRPVVGNVGEGQKFNPRRHKWGPPFRVLSDSVVPRQPHRPLKSYVKVVATMSLYLVAVAPVRKFAATLAPNLNLISHAGSGTGGGSTKRVSGDGRISSTSSMIRSYAVGSTFGG